MIMERAKPVEKKMEVPVVEVNSKPKKVKAAAKPQPVEMVP